MTQASPLYQLVDTRLDGKLADLVAARRPDTSWREIAEEIRTATRVVVNPETLRLWFVDRLVVTVAVRDDKEPAA